MSPMRLTVRPKRLAAFLAVIILGLAVAHLAVLYVRYGLGHDSLMGLLPLFDLDEESNLPTWFSSFNLLLSAVLLALIVRVSRARQDGRVRQWTILTWIFLFLSIDELAAIHDRVGNRLGASLVHKADLVSDYFHFPWVVPGIIAVLVVGLILLPLLTSLPSRTRLLFVLAAILFVGGALGFELIAARHVSNAGGALTYGIYTLIEETMEMSGIALFNYALVEYLSQSGRGANWHLQLAAVPDRGPRQASDSEETDHSASARVPESCGS